MARILYDLCAADDLRFSPYCWRVKLALFHKGLCFQTRPVRFTEKYKLEFSGQTLVPVLDDNGTTVTGSWEIAEYLEDTYSKAPILFPGNEGRHLAKLTSEWIDNQHKEILSFFVLDILNKLDPKDRTYFRSSREERYGKRLEEVQSDREKRIKEFREVNLAALRAHITDRHFISGQQPAYGDFAVFGTFQWARLVSEFDLLEEEDPVYAWRARMIKRT